MSASSLFISISNDFRLATWRMLKIAPTGPSWSMAAADYDKNGWTDLLYGNGSGVTFMRANSTGTGFSEISGSEYVFSQRSNFVDLNNDGNLDAFVCHDVSLMVMSINK